MLHSHFIFSGCVGVVKLLSEYFSFPLEILQGKPDIRMAFIQFVLSFLVSGDSALVGQIIQIKGNMLLRFQLCTVCAYLWSVGDIFLLRVSELLPEILSTGLREERLSIVNLILSTLKSRVSVQQVLSV